MNKLINHITQVFRWMLKIVFSQVPEGFFAHSVVQFGSDIPSIRQVTHLRILGAPPVSSEEEGSPIICPNSKTNETTKITYNYNFDNDRHLKTETTITSESWARRL